MEHGAESQNIWVPVSALLLAEAYHFVYRGLSFTWYEIVSLFWPLTHNSLFLEPHNKVNALLIQNSLSSLGSDDCNPYGLYAAGFRQF